MTREMGDFNAQLEKMRTHPGFIAALDQSGGSTPGALRAYGIKEGAWSTEEQMFAIVHQMRTRIVTSPAFTGYSPRRMWRSVPQIVVSVMRITASPTPGRGRATSSTRISLGP